MDTKNRFVISVFQFPSNMNPLGHLGDYREMKAKHFGDGNTAWTPQTPDDLQREAAFNRQRTEAFFKLFGFDGIDGFRKAIEATGARLLDEENVRLTFTNTLLGHLENVTEETRKILTGTWPSVGINPLARSAYHIPEPDVKKPAPRKPARGVGSPNAS